MAKSIMAGPNRTLVSRKQVSNVKALELAGSPERLKLTEQGIYPRVEGGNLRRVNRGAVRVYEVVQYA